MHQSYDLNSAAAERAHGRRDDGVRGGRGPSRKQDAAAADVSGRAQAGPRRLVEQHFRQLLQTAVSDVVSGSSRGHSELVVSGQPCVEIVRIADARDADLIVMGIDARRLEEAPGDTTSCVMQLARKSVLLVPERLFRPPRLGRKDSRGRPH